MVHLKKLGFIAALSLLSFASCQSGKGLNPCLSEEWVAECPQPLLLSPQLPLVPSSTSRPIPVIEKETPASITTVIPTTEPIPTSGNTPSSTPTATTATPTLLAVSPDPGIAQVHKLSLGPSIFTFSGPQEQTQLVGFAFDRNGNSIPFTELELVWTSSRPELFSVNAQGVVTTRDQTYSGSAIISITDSQTGVTASMAVTVGRSGGSTRTNNTVSEIAPSEIRMVSPIRQRFVPDRPLPLQALFSTTEQILQEGARVVFYDENAQVVGESTGPFEQTNTGFSANANWEDPPLGTHQVSAHLLNNTGELLAQSEAITLNISDFGLTSYYVNTTTDRIYAVNLSRFEITSSTEIPGASADFPSPGGTIDTLAKHPISGRVYYEGRSGSNNNRLYYWDPDEGIEASAHHYIGEVIESLSGTRRNISMMSFSTTTEKLYGFGLTDGNYELFEIDPATGVVYLISLTAINGSTLPNSSGGDLAVDKNGDIYLATGNRLYKIKIETSDSATVDLLGNVQRIDNGDSVGSISSLGFDALNRAHVIGTYDGSVLLYRLQTEDMTQATELLNFTSQDPGLLNGITSSGGDMTSTHE